MQHHVTEQKSLSGARRRRIRLANAQGEGIPTRLAYQMQHEGFALGKLSASSFQPTLKLDSRLL